MDGVGLTQKDKSDECNCDGSIITGLIFGIAITKHLKLNNNKLINRYLSSLSAPH